ncbi:SRPBCC family protein [Dyadobacter sp. CY312]|uniref:SRPBCC family protein n=1 Tax=Dyadobacter sp. CY312 TaxID=2907303 RepID=UPI001F3F0A69|nr:SRPBCC family protein [Dyadobacter sp. CY312]MCE7040242.1 SRPBCC family protein [Dyadobacter sp. CY312]
MKIIVRILAVIASLIGLALVAALFVKNDYDVHREIVINKPKSEVFDYAKYLENQKNYNTWLMADPNAKIESKGTDGTVGFIYSWDGNDQVGKGEQQIKNIVEGERLETEIHFIEPFEALAQQYLLTEAAGANQTKVTWGMKGESKYPMNFMNLFNEGMLGKEMTKSLENLKAVLEK